MSTLSRHETSIRIALTIVGLWGLVFAHPAVPLLCIVLLSLAYRSFEALALGLLVDFAWQPVGLLHPLPYCTIAAIVIVWALEPLRTQLLR